nr:glycosyltransferase family 2 protein [Herbaspirillum sp. B39]
MSPALISLSVVSHGHRAHIALLLADLARLRRTDIEVILTVNLPESFDDLLADLPFPVVVVNNPEPKGFAANQNAAVAHASGQWFVILNPDIRFHGDPFDALLEVSRMVPPAIVAPLIVNAQGQEEDSARHFPSPLQPFKRYLARLFGVHLANDSIPARGQVAYPDWVAGMFMMLPKTMMEQLGGLDERYRMYYEDVDLCARARLAGHEVRVARAVPVEHNAQRDSHRKLRYLRWHVSSVIRFFTSPAYRSLRQQRTR